MYELLADPFVKIKHEKTDNQPFGEFKYLKKTNYTVAILKCYPFIVPLPGFADWCAFLEPVLLTM